MARRHAHACEERGLRDDFPTELGFGVRNDSVVHDAALPAGISRRRAPKTQSAGKQASPESQSHKTFAPLAELGKGTAFYRVFLARPAGDLTGSAELVQAHR